MSEEHKTKVMNGFYITIGIILITGFIAGIVCGNLLKTPTKEALEAISELSKSTKYYPDVTLMRVAEETHWGGMSWATMLGIWCTSAISAFFVYIKKLQIEMMDIISWTVHNMGEKLDSLTEKQAETAAIEEQKADIA